MDSSASRGAGSSSSSTGLAPVGSYEDSLQLLERFRANGDLEALNALFARYYERVRRIACIRMGSRLRRLTESDDLVQNTFAVAFRKLEEVEIHDHSSLIQYLSRVLENQIRDALDYFDAQKRLPPSGPPLSTEGNQQGSASIDAVATDPGPLETLAMRELGELYDACVQALDPVHREVVLLREYADASWVEIQERLSRPSVHAARLLYSRAQIKLAQKLRQRLGR